MTIDTAAAVLLIVTPLWFNTTFALLGVRRGDSDEDAPEAEQDQIREKEIGRDPDRPSIQPSRRTASVLTRSRAARPAPSSSASRLSFTSANRA